MSPFFAPIRTASHKSQINYTKKDLHILNNSLKPSHNLYTKLPLKGQQNLEILKISLKKIYKTMQKNSLKPINTDFHVILEIFNEF